MLSRLIAYVLPLILLGTSCNGNPTGGLTDRVRERWYQSQPGWSEARPAILGDLAYFGTGDGQVIARDVRTGVQRWATRLSNGDAVKGAAILIRSGVVIVPVIGHVSGVDAATGRLLWHYVTPRDTVGRGSAGAPGQVSRLVPAADDQTVFLPAWGASLSAVDVRSGQPRWIWTPGRFASDTAASIFRSGAAGAALSGDTVFVTGWHNTTATGVRSESWIAALDRGTGRELWRLVLPHLTGGVTLEGGPGVYRNLLLVAERGGDVWAIDRATRQVAWHRVSTPTYSTGSGVVLYGDAVYVDGGDEHLYALNAADGALRWRAPFAAHTADDFLVTERRIMVSNGGTMYILDRESGRSIAAVIQPYVPQSQSLFTSPSAHANGQIFVSVADAAWSFDEP